MLVNEDNMNNEEYVAELVEILQKEQVYVGPGCLPLVDYLRQKDFAMYRKFKDRVPEDKK